MPRNSSFVYLAVVAAILAVFAGLAILFGYISVDSWYYMLLADAVRHDRGCSLHGAYMAVYPCGYPVVLALTTPSTDPAVLMIASKITNLILLAVSFWFILKASKQVAVAALVILNPVTLIIGMYTWSENLLLFCTCGVVFAISQIHEDDRRFAPYAGLTAFLILGCFARYVFGPFAFLLFLCAWAAFGKRTAWRAFPCFAIAGLVFLGYQAINHAITGYATGMPRVAAPEAPLYLIRQFLIAFGVNGLGVLIAGILLLAVPFRQRVFSRTVVSDAQRPVALFIALAGASFLVLAFILRFRTLFDPYNTRTIGYGIVLAAAGLAGLFVRDRAQTPVWPVAAMIVAALFSLIYMDDGALVQSIHDAFDDYQFPAGSLAALKSPAPPADVMVFFQLPVPGLDSVNVDNVEEVYYGKDVTAVTPEQGPDNIPETPAAFLRRIGDARGRTCRFDFTPFATAQDFQTYLNQTTPVDHRLGRQGWQDIARPNFQPDMRAYLLGIFQSGRLAGRLINCRDILALPQSRNALAGH